MSVKKKSSTLSLIIKALIAALVLTAFTHPVMRVLYPLRYDEEILKYSREFELNEYLVMGIISAESGFDEDAQSHKSAKGLMQLKEETALWCIENLNLDADRESIFIPEKNIYIGCAYLAYLEDLYGGNITNAIAAYNAGLGNVNKWLSDPRYADKNGNLKIIPFAETEKYVKKVKKRAEIYHTLYGSK